MDPDSTPLSSSLQTGVARPFGPGLRAQILVALSVAFVVSFTLLSFAVVQLTQRARQTLRREGATAVAHAVATAVDGFDTGRLSRTTTLLDGVIGRASIAGIEIEHPGLERRARGRIELGEPVEAKLRDGGTVRVWVAEPLASELAPLTNLMLLYVAVTGGAILLLAFVALTYLIVRPVSILTRASERLAAGRRHVDVPVRGAAEIARLALAFNTMAAQLRGERKKLEQRLDELERTTAELNTAEAKLVRSERLASVGRLGAGVAHEIGNPLSAILGLVELLQGGDLETTERAEFLRRIQSETERIHQIIRKLLNFSRQGGDREIPGSADLVRAVENAVGLVAPQKDLRQVTIERRIAADVPLVRGTEDELTQVALNLLLNAADAIEGDGTIVIDIHPQDESQVAMTVTDTGPGIAPTVRDHLFEPFVTTKAPGQGTGLGLAVCHTIVQRFGGTMGAENAPEGGARFEIRLPVADV